MSLDLAFQALADPARRAMVQRLCRGPATVSELAEPHDMSLAAVVQHVNVLENSGLVQTEKVGRVRTCRLDAAALNDLERWIFQRRTEWSRHLERLGDYLEEEQKRRGSR